jgi:hypothetical protein
MLTTLLAGICSCQRSSRVRCTNLSTPFLEVAYFYAHLPAYAYFREFLQFTPIARHPVLEKVLISILSLRPKKCRDGPRADPSYWRRGHPIYETNSSLPLCRSSPPLSPLPSCPIFIMPAFLFFFSDHLILLSAPFRLVLPARILCQWPTPSHELMILGLDSQQDCGTCLHHYCDS